MKNKLIFLLLVILTSANANANAIVLEESLKYSGAMTVSDLSYLELPSNLAADKIDLSFVIEKDSKWNVGSNLKSHLSRVEKTLNSCDLTLGLVKIIKVNINDEKFSTVMSSRDIYKKAFAEIDLLEPTTRLENPTFFLLKARKVYNGKAFAMTEMSILRAPRLKQDWSNLQNTSFITDDKMSHIGAGKTYSVISHEMAHLLGEFGHISNNNNLMSTGAKNHQLNKSQCEMIRDNFKL